MPDLTEEEENRSGDGTEKEKHVSLKGNKS